MNTLRYLKWDDTVISLIDETNAVRFTEYPQRRSPEI
jgi:hypothetical protein